MVATGLSRSSDLKKVRRGMGVRQKRASTKLSQPTAEDPEKTPYHHPPKGSSLVFIHRNGNHNEHWSQSQVGNDHEYGPELPPVHDDCRIPTTIPTKARETKKMQLKAYLLHQLEVSLVINDKFKNLPSESYKSQLNAFIDPCKNSRTKGNYVLTLSHCPKPLTCVGVNWIPYGGVYENMGLH